MVQSKPLAKHITWFLIAVFGLLITNTRPSHARKPKRCSIWNTCGVKVFPGKSTVLSFETTVIDAYTTQQSPKFVVTRYVEEVTVEPVTGAQDDSLQVKVQGDKVGLKHKVGVVLEIVGRAEDRDMRVDFYNPYKEKEERTKVLQEDFDGFLAEQILRGFSVAHSETLPPTNDVPLAVKVVTLRLGEQVRLICRMENSGSRPFPLEDIRVPGPDNRLDHVAAIRVESTHRASEGLLADIPPKHTIAMVVTLKEPRVFGEFATMQLVAASGASRSENIQIWPPPEYKAPGKQKDHVTVQAQGRIGAISLKNSADQTEFTRLLGGGGRVLYGIASNLSLEGSLSILSSNEAKFSNNSRIQATMVRGLVGAVLHLGRGKWTPHLRGGIGGRLSSFNLTPGEDELRGTGLYWFAIGIDVWGTDGFVFGASVQLVSQVGDGDDATFSLEAGAHAGFAWKPQP